MKLLTKILISPEAKRDMLEIKEYITEELGSPIASKNVTDKIIKQISRLSDFPKIGASLSSIIDIETNYRFLVCGNYTAFYRYTDETAFVDRILYGKRDFMRILFEQH